MGAPESNAGDDFHFWWAASRALALIDPGTKSQLLVVEGLAKVDDPDDQYEIADVAEYLGGSDFASASSLLISQLKYSTRHPDVPWTAARLTRKSRRSGTGGSAKAPRSLIRDLAETYGRLVSIHGRDAVMQKVHIRLVSNQPGDPLLQGSIAAAARWLDGRPSGSTRAALLKALPRRESGILGSLADAVGNALSSRAFCDFLTVLDLSSTGSLNRAALTRSVQSGAVELVPGRGLDPGRQVFDLVRRQALPESRREGLTAADVLAELGVADVVDLYPAPSRLATLTNPLPAPGARVVADAAAAHLGEVVVAHGAAGAGKTTAIRQVADHLPEGSEVLLYDCYGGGEYLSAGEERHTSTRFVMQMVNDLAQRCGTPLLVQPPSQEDDLWRVLSRRLTSAARALPAGAVLVLAVDAADNAAVAATERGDRSFLPGLTTLRLPAQVAVVLTSRSHRIDTIGASHAPTVEIVQFDQATSANHLLRHRPAASVEDAAAFHEGTGGNPRVQFYVLEQAAANAWGIPQLLAACTRTPEPLFADLLESALRGGGASLNGQRWLSLMLALARPISIDTLAIALDVDKTVVSAFAAGLAPGVRLVDDAVRFRDEDFETFVRSRVDEADVLTAHGRLADLFLVRRSIDPDAAAHVADHLSASGRHDELLQLVLAEESPRGIADGFRREQVQGRRLDLAVRSAVIADDPAVAVRIAARACDTASRSDTLSRLVESHLDLVARYADIDLLRAHALRQSRGTWLGPVHMRLAAALSRNSATHPAAREALESADAWVQRWMDGLEGETRHWDLEADELAAAAEAHFRLAGMEAAIFSLRRWQPADFVLDAAAKFAARTAGELAPDDVRAALDEAGVPAALQAPFLAYAASPSQRVDQGWIEAVVSDLVLDTSESRQPWNERLLGVVLRQGSKAAAEGLADHWARELPTSEWSFRSPFSDGIRGLRCHAAKAALGGTDLDVQALIPTSLRPVEAREEHARDPRGRERGEWTRTVGALGPMALLASRAAAGEPVAHAVAAQVDASVSSRLAQAKHRWFKYDKTFHAWAVLAVEAVADSDAPVAALERICGAAPALVREGAPELWLDLADILVARPQHFSAALELCVRAAASARTNAHPAPERLDLLARAADLSSKIAPDVGRRLFDQAVETATGINDDAARLLAVHADLTHRATLEHEGRRRVATQLVQASEDVAPHVTDPDVIPYEAVAGAASRLDAGVGLAAVSRWDDEARVQMRSTLSAALLGAVEGSAISVVDAMSLDHLLEDDAVRFRFQLTLMGKLPPGDAGRVAARRATTRASTWLRRHVPAAFQASFAGKLLEEVPAGAVTASVRAELEATRALALVAPLQTPTTWDRSGADGESAPGVQALLSAPEHRAWSTLVEDVALLDGAYVYGERLRTFVAAVLRGTPPAERVQALAAITEIEGRRGADVVLPVLSDTVEAWRAWPGVREWAESTLPRLLEQHLPDLVAWRFDIEPLVAQLRVLADDDMIRRAVLAALPECRPQLTAQGWQNVAALLGRLCPPTHAGTAVVGLLADRATGTATGTGRDEPSSQLDPIVMLLWSVLGHPRRQLRWRAAYAVRDLLTRSEDSHAAAFTAGLMACPPMDELGPYRHQELPFYRLSAFTALLMALARVAAERPDLLASHVDALTRIATSRELPHAQIRELARSAALLVTEHLGGELDELHYVNRAMSCDVNRGQRYSSDRVVSDSLRYRFDPMDTIPYWYAPLARVFGVETKTIAEHAERWILDRWNRTEDDWMSDVRELRDERSYRQMHNDHGAIPPEENLRLYLEYHAMQLAAGELLDAGTPVHVADWSEEDPWLEWLLWHLPSDVVMWLSERGSPVPLEPGLFGSLPPVTDWDVAQDEDYDSALELAGGALPPWVLVAGSTSLLRPGASGDVWVTSALVAPVVAADLQRALAAASDPRDFKLPDEDEDDHEIERGPFVLRGWLTRPHGRSEATDEHDPYAHGLSLRVTLPGRLFREAHGVRPDPTGLVLRTASGKDRVRAEQWSDPAHADPEGITSHGYRVRVERSALLRHLSDTGTTLIVEVQIGRHRRNREHDDYRTPRSRIYLVDATGSVTVR